MGYTHHIGEACICEEIGERMAWMGVETVHKDNDANWLCSGYGEWTEFTRRTGLHRVFYGQKSGEYGHDNPWWIDDEGEGHNDLIYTTKYAAPLTEAHYRAFVKARNEYPGRGKWLAVKEFDTKVLDFLVKWTRWALDHCKNPTYFND